VDTEDIAYRVFMSLAISLAAASVLASGVEIVAGRLACLLGFHALHSGSREIAGYRIYERVCLRCGYLPTWER